MCEMSYRQLNAKFLVVDNYMSSLWRSQAIQGQRELHQRKVRTMATQVRYKSLYISLLSFAKQQREMIKFCVFCRTQTTAPIFFRIFIWN